MNGYMTTKPSDEAPSTILKVGFSSAVFHNVIRESEDDMRPEVMMRVGDKSHHCWDGHGVVGSVGLTNTN